MNWLEIKARFVPRWTVQALALLVLGAPAGIAGTAGANSDSLLMVALYRGDAKLASFALENGANPNAHNSDGTTALVMAVLHSDYDTVKKMIDRGADVNARTAIGRTALISAAAVPGRSDMVKLLLDRGADPNLRGGDANGPVPTLAAGGETPLTEAAKSYDVRSLEVLIQHGAKVNEADNVGNTALLNASLHGNRAAVKILLANGASVHARSKFGPTPLVAAAMRNDAEIVTMLLAAGANPNETDAGGSSALMWAAYTETGDPAVLDILLKAGADVRIRNKVGGETAMTWAKRNGETLIVDRLRRAGVKDAEGGVEIAPKHVAFKANDAMARALATLQRTSVEFAKNSGCISCHHQTLPGQAARMARERGITIDEQQLDRDQKRVMGFIRPARPMMLENTDLFPDVQVSGSYVLWYLSEMGQPSDAVTEALTRNIALHQQMDGRWVGWAPRPPLEFGDIQATALSLNALRLYGAENRRQEYEERVERASRWLQSVEPATEHQKVYQLFGLMWSNAPQAAIDRVARQVLAAQRPDGSWGQLRTLPGDAYATGQALYALHEAGSLKTTDPRYVRGKQFLLETQYEDGSWLVKTRAFPFQPLKDTKFPHGRDQWISATGTSWAVMALAAEDKPAAYAKAGRR